MPFRPDPFLEWFEPLRKLRRRPATGVITVVVSIGAATAARSALMGALDATPFITFYPAVVVSTLLGGLWAGLAAIALSAALAGYLFLGPVIGFSAAPGAIVPLLVYVLITLMLVGIVALLNTALDRLSQAAEQSRFILETEPTGVIAVDERGTIELVNTAAEHQFGYSHAELIGQPVELLIPHEQRIIHTGHRAAFMENPSLRAMGAGRDLKGRRKDGTLIPVEVGLNPFRRGDRHGVLATIIDITERKNLEGRASILAREVGHRASNLLTIVGAVARRTIPEGHREPFLGILDSLARTQRVFGEATTAPLRAIVEHELAGFMAQVGIVGCDIELTPQVAQDFTLIIHELATNGLKHGALSVPTGRVLVEGSEDETGQFRFAWRESGGPRAEPPTEAKVGFGTTILRDLAGAFATDIVLDYSNGLFRYELWADAAALRNTVRFPAAARQ
ncbi:PAS domain S-box protein [Mesorhizobium sp. VK4C]|uniref:PAS domain S-box protein n=1 Tax=Mesorhizobium captivum TaxID=3072319 RepID=UPI002A23BD57|nr:PAS domain S-box protein [Mesorhizobium sp. VK4C]MDX8500920.1 PAS domain S-box protein [Mesorhizobium sp. VK4C]